MNWMIVEKDVPNLSIHLIMYNHLFLRHYPKKKQKQKKQKKNFVRSSEQINGVRAEIEVEEHGEIAKSKLESEMTTKSQCRSWRNKAWPLGER